MNLLVMENLFYDRRFTKVLFVTHIPFANMLTMLVGWLKRYMTLKDRLGTVMFSRPEEKTKFFWTRT